MHLNLIPHSHPEELKNITLLDRLNCMEKKLSDLQVSTDRVLAENLQVSERFTKHFSYSAAVQHLTLPKAQTNPVFNKENHSSKGMSAPNPPTVTRVMELQFTVPPPVKSPCKPPKQKLDDLLFKSSNNAIKNQNGFLISSGHTIFKSPGFEFPKCRKRKIIVGKEKSISTVKGALEPLRDLFVFRVHKDTSTSDKNLSDYIIPLELACVSNPDSKFKSYKLSVFLSHSKAAFNADIWPKGIIIRNFYNLKNKQNERFDKSA